MQFVYVLFLLGPILLGGMMSTMSSTTYEYSNRARRIKYITEVRMRSAFKRVILINTSSDLTDRTHSTFRSQTQAKTPDYQW